MRRKLNLPNSLLALICLIAAGQANGAEKEPLHVLFLGNSYTARHNLAQVVEKMAEEGNPGVDFVPTTVIYGGRTMADHWRLGSENFVRRHEITAEEIKASIAELEKNPGDKYSKGAIGRLKKLLTEIDEPHEPHPKWDVVVLQSYRDDIEGDPTKYAKFAPKFAEQAKAQGAKVILYETSSHTQNAKPLETAPDEAPILKKAEKTARLARETGAAVAPMSLAAYKCQVERPDFTLRFINDAHLNHTMAYMTACAIYAAVFDKSPVGLKTDSITDIRFYEKEPKNREKDRDGNPITRKFNEKDRADLQRFAWEAYQEMKAKTTNE